MIEKKPVLIDCDTGIDDMVSFILTLACEDLDIMGVTTVAGNVGLESTTYNTLNGLTLMGRDEIPLAVGEKGPLYGTLKDASEIHGDTGLGGYQFTNPTEKKPVNKHAVDFLHQILMESKKRVTILALAPLTNIAKLLMTYPDCKDKIEKIVFMGGSIFSGNPTPVATFNVWVDPEAARYVMKSGVSFYMCPLDTTREAYFTEKELEQIKLIDNPVAEMAAVMMRYCSEADNKYVNGKKRFKGICVHDLCTAAYVTNPELFKTVPYYGDVEVKGTLTRGFTLIDYENILGKPDNEKNINYIYSVDRDGLIDVFFKALKKYSK